MAIDPMEREGCWLCDGVGAIETFRADGSEETAGCPVCVENDLQWWREKAERGRDLLAKALRHIAYGNVCDHDGMPCVREARAALKAMESE